KGPIIPGSGWLEVLVGEGFEKKKKKIFFFSVSAYGIHNNNNNNNNNKGIARWPLDFYYVAIKLATYTPKHENSHTHQYYYGNHYIIIYIKKILETFRAIKILNFAPSPRHISRYRQKLLLATFYSALIITKSIMSALSSSST